MSSNNLGGAYGIQTHDLGNANALLYRSLSFTLAFFNALMFLKARFYSASSCYLLCSYTRKNAILKCLYFIHF